MYREPAPNRYLSDYRASLALVAGCTLVVLAVEAYVLFTGAPNYIDSISAVMKRLAWRWPELPFMWFGLGAHFWFYRKPLPVSLAVQVLLIVGGVAVAFGIGTLWRWTGPWFAPAWMNAAMALYGALWFYVFWPQPEPTPFRDAD